MPCSAMWPLSFSTLDMGRQLSRFSAAWCRSDDDQVGFRKVSRDINRKPSSAAVGGSVWRRHSGLRYQTSAQPVRVRHDVCDGVLRHGHELGAACHDAGMLMKKRNTFYDFIDCAEHLMRRGWTVSECLAIEGGGGLMIGAVMDARVPPRPPLVCRPAMGRDHG
ncbi:MAG: prolyl oligopeptidase family serine peptidase [Terriglobales bacterium]